MSDPSIVLIVADCLRPDLPILGYPRPTTPLLDGALRRARGFDRCYSVCGWTLPACASIVTGQPPDVHGLVDHDGRFRAPKLGHYLGEGYVRHGIANNGNLVSDHVDQAYLERLGARRDDKWKRFGWDLDFDRYEWFHRLDHDAPFARASVFLREHGGRDQPFFLFLHSNLVHDYSLDRPYYRAVREWFDGELPPELTAFEDGPRSWSSLRERFAEQYLIRQLKARYDCGIVELDRRLAALFAHIDLERTVVVLTSDHGEGFRPDLGRVHHCGRLHDDLLHVPLFIWVPPGLGGEGGLDSRICSTLDIAPTLLRLAGRPAAHLPGQALLEPAADAHRRLLALDRAYVFWPGEDERADYDRHDIEVKATLVYPLKAIHMRRDRARARELYNLAYDPDEEHDLLDLPPPEVPRLSFVVVINDWDEFRHHVSDAPSYRGGRHQWILLDNTGNHLSADICRLYVWGAARASGELIVFAHQDVFFPPGWEQNLVRSLGELAERDPDWGVIGSVGMAFGTQDSAQRRMVGHWSDPSGHHRTGVLPAPVQSLDEQWLAIRRDAGLRFDTSLPGFHCYGVDLCLTAQARGMRCYAVDAFVWHKYRKADGSLPLAPRHSEKIMRRATPAFIADAQRGYTYVGRKWRSRMPFFSTSMSWTDPSDLVYAGPRFLAQN